MEAVKKKNFKLPHAYIILMSVMILIVVLSWIIPSGEFARVADEATGRDVIDPKAFSYIEKSDPISVMDFFMAIHDGIVSAMGIGAAILIVTGTISILEMSGVISAGIYKIIQFSKGREEIVIAIFLLAFTLIGAAGIAEEVMAFIPIVISIVMSMGYDRMVGYSAITIGILIGFASGPINIFTIAIAQQLVGLPLFSGLVYRFFGLGVFYVITLIYLLAYCKKIKADPTKSLVAEEYLKSIKTESSYTAVEFTWQRKIELVGFVLVFIAMIYGTLELDWGFSQIGAAFLIYTFAVVLISRLNIDEACNEFTKGASGTLSIVFLIGIAQAIKSLMTQAKIIDTFIYHLSLMFDNKSAVTTLLLLYLAVVFFEFFVGSGPGKAVLLMPILSPLGKMLSINQQVIVLAFQYGDGILNFVNPTSGTLHAMLAIGKIEYSNWIKFTWKLFLILFAVAFGIILLSHYINYGPF